MIRTVTNCLKKIKLIELSKPRKHFVFLNQKRTELLEVKRSPRYYRRMVRLTNYKAALNELYRGLEDAPCQ